MPRRLLDHNPVTGVSTYHEYDDVTRTTYIETRQDVGQALRVTKELAKSDGTFKHGVRESFMLGAILPVVMVEKFMREHHIDVFRNNRDDWRGTRRLLNGEYRDFKTIPGKL